MLRPSECTVVLASASPRRRRLFGLLGLKTEAVSVDTLEDLDSPLAQDPPALVRHLAVEKAIAADTGSSAETIVLAFDTVVVLDHRLLGKPVDVTDAWRMLRALSGRSHQVVTGVALLLPNREAPIAFAVSTNVRMKTLSDAQIQAWMDAGEYMGCAGAYNIEAQVAEVDLFECFQNVAGLPLCHVFAALEAERPSCAALDALSAPVSACDSLLGRKCELGPRLIPIRDE